MNEDAQLNRTPPGISCEGIAPTNSPPRRSSLSSLGISCEGIAPINSPPQGATAPLGTSCNGIAQTNSHPVGAALGPPSAGVHGIAQSSSAPGCMGSPRALPKGTPAPLGASAPECMG